MLVTPVKTHLHQIYHPSPVWLSQWWELWRTDECQTYQWPKVPDWHQSDNYFDFLKIYAKLLFCILAQSQHVVLCYVTFGKCYVLPKALAIAMLSRRPIRGIIARPPPRSCCRHMMWNHIKNQSYLNIQKSIIFENKTTSLTSTMSLKDTIVPFGVISEKGGGLNGGRPLVVFPVRVK